MDNDRRRDVEEALKWLSDIEASKEKIRELDEGELRDLYSLLTADFATFMQTETQRLPVRNRLMMDFGYTTETIEQLEYQD